MADEISVRGYSLTRFEIDVIDRVSQERALFNSSAALRQIIREWELLQKTAANDNNGEKPRGEA